MAYAFCASPMPPGMLSYSSSPSRIEAANAQDMMLYDRAVALIEKDHRP